LEIINLMKKKVLVTGSSGFLGRRFIKDSNEFDIIEVDLLKQDVTDIDFSGIDSVLHLAALVHQMKRAPEEEYFKVNRDLAFEVAKNAKNQGVKHFILMSTVKVYGEYTIENEAWNEKTNCKPTDPYGKSKLEAEKLISALEDNKFKVVIIRSPLVYGAGVKANMLSLIKLVDKVPVIPLGGINNKRSFVYIGNLIALIKVIIDQQSSGIFICADDKALSTTELIGFIAKSLGKKRILIKANLLFRLIGYFKPDIIKRLFCSLELDNKLTNETLEFIVPYSVEQGIDEMINWYKKCYKQKL